MNYTGSPTWVECELWTYWKEMRPMNIIARLPIAPQEGDDIIVDRQQYTVMRRRIAHEERLRLYVALEDDRVNDGNDEPTLESGQ